ncbi:MAG TPA: DsbA family protein [Steroidobacteraceae bacterium]|jgi:protein-disulfide isomerase|nr:DsbA family protein [Steroidobacteraceae bacterium]
MMRNLALLCVLTGLLGGMPVLQAQMVPAQAVAAVTAPPLMPAAGAEHPDVVIVEYMDYNCPYCREMAPDLDKLLHSDPRVQILYKEWPILGDTSIYAARAALAASWQGKYLIAHNALIGASRGLERNSDVDAVLRAAGLDLRRLDADRKAHAGEIDALLARSERETHTLGLQGTPGLLVGRHLLSSAQSLPQLQRLVAQSRSSVR